MRLLLAALIAALLFLLFPLDSDAALASDGVWFGLELEHHGIGFIRGNHPLFHLLAWPVAEALQLAGAAHPGLLATRLVAAICGGLTVLLVAAFARRRALAFGVAAAACVLSFRMFVIESATGENVVPAILAALAATWAALHGRRRPVLVGALLSIALMARQDNVFLVPGITLAVLPRGRRTIGRALAFLVPVGIAVAALYLAAWRLAAPHQPPATYLLGLGAKGAWDSDPSAKVPPAIGEIDAIAVAAFGRHWPEDEIRPLLGVLALLVPLALALGRRAFQRATIEWWLFGVPVAARLLFYGWFEPRNPEWQLFGLVFSCALAARLARLSRPMPLFRTRAAVLFLCAAATLALHLPYTLRLRRTVFRDAVAEAVRQAPPDSVVAIEGFGAPAMLQVMGIPATIIVGSPAEVLGKLGDLVAKNPGRPVLAITDRFVADTMPETLDHLAERRPELDRYADNDRMKVIRKDGLTYAILMMPR